MRHEVDAGEYKGSDGRWHPAKVLPPKEIRLPPPGRLRRVFAWMWQNPALSMAAVSAVGYVIFMGLIIAGGHFYAPS